jgi:hypothetical protein
MSEYPGSLNAAASRSPGITESGAGSLSDDGARALELCLQAADHRADLARAGEILDELETLLPTLGESDINTLLDNPDYREVRNLLLHCCAAAWFARECDLARKALAGPASSILRNLFGEHIPREAYADELAVLEELEPRRILILGSGPCPMSAIVLRDAFSATTIVGVDRDPEACELSSGLLLASGYSTVAVRNGDAAGPIDLAGFDCVLMALTVGEDEVAKRRIIEELRSRADPDATLVVRTAVGWGRVLYPTVDIPEIAARAARQPVRTLFERSVAVPVRVSELPH